MASLKKAEWKAKKVVMQVILNCGGTVFGGAVRDWVIHDHFADLYYGKEAEGFSKQELDERYEDPEFMPELKDRLVMPVDVDACVTRAQLDKVLSSLRRKKLMAYKLFNRDPTGYIDEWMLPPGKVRHMRYQVMMRPANLFPALYGALFSEVASVLRERLRAMARELEEVLDGANGERTFHMDLMVYEKDEDVCTQAAPFAPLDFQCNGLLMNRERGLFMSNRIALERDNPIAYHRKYLAVMRDVVDRRAVRNDMWREIPGYRVSNMLGKGWDICDFQCVERVPAVVLSTDIPAPMCMICHDDLDKAHYKMKCCEARMHLGCVHSAMTRGVAAMTETLQCIMCRQGLCAVQDDAIILGSIVDHFAPKNEAAMAGN